MEESLNQKLKKIALDALNTAKNSDPQFRMNGNNNIWILKPIYMSRGRGIKLFDQFGKIMDHIIGNDVQYVAQKYIENPMLINRKKFDIRLWVLVQDFCPPRIWVYNECYIRICATDFTSSNLDNRFIHLTNNCVQKFNQNKNKTEIMWTQQQLADLLQEKSGRNIFFEEIQPKMWEIIVWSLRCVADSVGARKNSMEVFGYDFMIDEDYQPWLIEINSSPCMEYSTKITSRLCKAVMQDTIRVIIDYTWAKKGTKKSVNTGGFILIDKGNIYPVVHYNANKSTDTSSKKQSDKQQQSHNLQQEDDQDIDEE